MKRSPATQALVEKALSLEAERDRLRQINEELVTALEKMLHTQPFANDGIEGIQQNVTSGDVDACRFARAALAKAKEQA